MVFGVGMDCVEIARMEKSLCSTHFEERVFGKGERALFARKGRGAAASAAACFAAKEAFLKACGKGLGAFDLIEIEALRGESGRPYLALSGGAEHYRAQNGLRCHLTLCHEAGLAFAYVLLEKAEQGGNNPTGADAAF